MYVARFFMAPVATGILMKPSCRSNLTMTDNSVKLNSVNIDTKYKHLFFT